MGLVIKSHMWSGTQFLGPGLVSPQYKRLAFYKQLLRCGVSVVLPNEFRCKMLCLDLIV